MDIVLILSIVLAIILVLIAAILLIPIDISLRLFKRGALAQLHMSIGVLMGVASGHIDFSIERGEFQLRVLGITLLRRDLEKREEKPTDWGKIIGNANELYDAVICLVGAFTKNLSIKRLRGEVKVGLSDPSQTGMLTGFLYASSGMVKAFLPKTSLEIEPSFEEEKMDAEVELEFSLPLIKVIIPLVHFFRRSRKIF